MIKTPRVIVVGDLHIAQTRNVFVGDEFSQSLTDQFLSLIWIVLSVNKTFNVNEMLVKDFMITI